MEKGRYERALTAREKYLSLPREYKYMMWDKKKYLLWKIDAHMCERLMYMHASAIIHIILLIFTLQLWQMFVRN